MAISPTLSACVLYMILCWSTPCGIGSFEIWDVYCLASYGQEIRCLERYMYFSSAEELWY